jgi:hypothetical protein
MSVEGEIALSRRLGLPYVELGGLALAERVRRTNEALRMILAGFALAQLLGGGVGLGAATWRNHSASILRRLGGQPLAHGMQNLPPYWEPQYGCRMEVLRFYSWSPNPRYRAWIDELKDYLCNICIYTREAKDFIWNYRKTLVPHATWCDTTTVPYKNSRSHV